MLVVRSAGRLGNQLFVFSACQKALKPSEKLVLFGFDELVAAFPELAETTRHVPLPRRKWWIWTAVHQVLALLSFLRLTRRLVLAHDGSRLRVTAGLLPVRLFDAGFCQDSQLLQKASDLALWDTARVRHGAFLASCGLDTKSVNDASYFIHVRRGDYLNHPSPEFPAVLPSSWFINQMETIRSSNPKARFLVFSDDLDYCQRKFGADPTVSLVDGDAVQSLLAMSLCKGGVLSASSLSWWAAYLSSERSEGPFIAPKYWINWRSQSWGTETLESSPFVHWVNVPLP